METAYDGRQIVGMDLHRRRSVLVRMTEDGRRLDTARITNSAAELRREISRAGKSPKVVLEATYGWYWAAETLAAAGAEAHLLLARQALPGQGSLTGHRRGRGPHQPWPRLEGLAASAGRDNLSWAESSSPRRRHAGDVAVSS